MREGGVLAIGDWQSAIGDGVLAIGYWLLAIGNRVSWVTRVVSCAQVRVVAQSARSKKRCFILFL